MKLGVGLVAYEMSNQYVESLSDSLNGIDLVYKVVIDNSPTDKKRLVFEKYNWTYIHLSNNPGFGFSHNKIFEKFGDLSEFHLVVNPDISFDPSCILELVGFMKNNPSAGAVSPAIYYPDGGFQELRKLLPSPYGWFLRRFMRNSKQLNRYNELFELKMAPKNGVFKYPYMSGSFMLLRTEVIDKIGLFDDKIFMYGEDTDLSRRLWINGTEPYYYGKVSAVHVFAKGSHKSKRLLFIAIKSTIYYFNKWGWIDRERVRINNECLNQFRDDV